MDISLAQRISSLDMDHRDTQVWQTRGLGLIFIFGLVSLLAAVVTFTAHNLTYLSTVGKLFGLGVLLLAAVGGWIKLGLDKTMGAVMAGIAAQVLIGVWLAAAGQLYQAPGGLQDLLIIWAVLGLPFALASKHAAHSAVWLSLIFGISGTPAGQYLSTLYNDIGSELRILSWGALFSLIFVAALRLKAPIWLSTAVALVAAGFLLLSLQFSIWDGSKFWILIVASVITLGVAVWLYMRREALAALSLYSVVALSLPVTLLVEVIINSLDHVYAIMLLLALTFGAATFALVRIFLHYRQRYGYIKAKTSTAQSGTDDDVKSDISTDKTPWYMDVLIALGGVLTAIFATLFIGAFLGVIAALSGLEEVIMSVVGLGLYGLFFWRRLKESSPYLRYLFGTFLLIGQITATIGLADFIGWQPELMGLVSIALAAPVLWFIRQRIMEVIQSVIIAASVFFIFAEAFGGYNQPPALWLEPLLFLLLSGFASVCFFIRPQEGEAQNGKPWLKAATVVFLLAAIFAGLFNPEFLRETRGLLEDGQNSLVIMALRTASFAAALAGFWFLGLRRTLPPWPILAAITVVVALLPGGAAGAALLLLIGYAAGLRSYFHLGSLVALYFLFAAYYDLRLTLMELSAVLAISGIIFLGIWYVSRRKLLQVSPREATT